MSKPTKATRARDGYWRRLRKQTRFDVPTKRRNPVAVALCDRTFGQKMVKSIKTYSRKRKHPNLED